MQTRIDPALSSDAGDAARVRILLLLMSCAAMCHFNRVSMSVAGTERLMTEFSLSETQMGSVYSAYLLVYTIFMTPGGWLIDRFGPKALLSALGMGAAILTAATALPGLSSSFALSALASFLAIRALMGLVNVPLHPAAARAVASWFPVPARSWANGWVTAAALVGIALTYPLFGALIDAVGWRGAFLISSFATAIVATAWTIYASDGPGWRSSAVAKASSITPQSIDVDAESVASKESTLERPRYGSLALLTGSYAAVGYFQYLFFYWMQYYLEKVVGVDAQQSRLWTMIPTLAMALGMVAGGWLTLQMQTRLGRWRGLAIIPIVGMLSGAAFAVLGVVVESPVLVVGFFSLAMGAVGLAEGPFWTVAVELGGRRGGTSAALFNTGGNAGGGLAPVLTPLFSHFLGWKGGIAVASLLCVLGAALWLWIDPVDEPMETNG